MSSNCPACGQPTLKFFVRHSVLRCTNEACGEEFPDEAAAAAGSSGGTDAARLPLDSGMAALIARWPSILALSLDEYAREEHRVMKLWHACDVVELMLRFLVMVGVAEAARGGELPDPIARELSEKIERPVLGHWRGMAEALGKSGAAENTLVPEARRYLFDVLVPLLDGDSASRSAETSFSRLRNRLAHGAGVTKAMARHLLAIWQPRFEDAMKQAAWVGELSLVVQGAGGHYAELRGPAMEPAPVTLIDDVAGAAAAMRSDAVLLVRDARVLTLWPLALYGEPHAADSRPTGLGHTAQIYVRRGEVRLEYVPLGSDAACEAVGDQAALDAFQRIFHVERYRQEALAKGGSVRGFERDFDKDSQLLIGRTDETKSLRTLLDDMTQGVIWLSGPAGIGKSFTVARVVSELIEAAAEHQLILPYRFRVGDAERCNRYAFFLFAIERLEAWLQRIGERAASRAAGKPRDRLRQLLERVRQGGASSSCSTVWTKSRKAIRPSLARCRCHCNWGARCGCVPDGRNAACPSCSEPAERARPSRMACRA